MKSLEKAVDLMSQWPAPRAKEREEATSLLEAAIRDCEAAIALWQDYIANPGEPAKAERSVMTWIGAQRAKQLHELALQAQARIEQVCRMAGPPASRFVSLEEDLIEAPYGQLKAGQSGPDFAQQAVARLNERISFLGGLIARLRNTEPLRRSA